MKKLLLLLSLIIFACQSPTKISEKEVMNSFNSFFEVLDNDLDNFESVVTEDFFIFENSRRYSKEEFIELAHTERTHQLQLSQKISQKTNVLARYSPQ